MFFELLGLNCDQVLEWELPTRPIGRQRDGKAKRAHSDADWIGGAVELDAIPPDKMKELVEDAIKSHVDDDAWEKEQAVEASEREILERMLGGSS